MNAFGTRGRRVALLAVLLLVGAGVAAAFAQGGSDGGSGAAVEATTTTAVAGPGRPRRPRAEPRSARCTEGPVAAPTASRVIELKTPQVIEIGDQGFTPADFIAVRGFEIIWKNTSAAPKAIRFDNYSVTSEILESAPIPPGGSWSWCPARGASIVYSSSSLPGVLGHFQVEEERKPGESPI